jgi:hypothetical protein
VVDIFRGNSVVVVLDSSWGLDGVRVCVSERVNCMMGGLFLGVLYMHGMAIRMGMGMGMANT